MKALIVSITMTLGLLSFGAAHAQAPASAPAGSTGLCKDGTYSSADSKKGACRGHKGVKEWYAASAAAPAAKSTPAAASQASKKDAAPSTATPSAAAPAGATGLCNDGTYYSGESKKGACRGHKGVKTWYGSTTAASTPSAPAQTPKAAPVAMPASRPPPMPAKTSAPAPAVMPASTPKTTTSSAPSSGGAGQVWVNSSTKVYHCPGDRYYGKTKAGEYMSESDAIAKGDRASGGKRCSS